MIENYSEYSKKEIIDNDQEDDIENEEKKLKISSCKELLEYEIQPEYFVVSPLVPREAITSITADSGKGKSLFALILAYHIAFGKKLFDEYEVEKGKVLIIDQEMNKNEIATRFKKVMNSEAPVDYIIDQSFLINDINYFTSLVESIAEHKYDVIIFDTFTEIHDGEENDSGDMKAVNKQLLRLIRLTNVSVIYLHHHRKPQKGERLSQSSSRGSSEIIAKVSSHLLLDSKSYADELGNQILDVTVSQEKARSSSRLNGKMSFKICNDFETDLIKWEYLGEVEEKGKKVEEAKMYILEVLQTEEGVTVKSLSNNSNIGTSNIRMALKELVGESKLDFAQKSREKYYFLSSS